MNGTIQSETVTIRFRIRNANPDLKLPDKTVVREMTPGAVYHAPSGWRILSAEYPQMT